MGLEFGKGIGSQERISGSNDGKRDWETYIRTDGKH